MKPDCSIRPATVDDAAAIAEIYNEAILQTTATFDMEPKSVEDRAAWLESLGERFCALVAETEGRIAAFAALMPYSERAAYDDTAETALYVASAWRGQGIGRRLYTELIAEAGRRRFHCLLARVTAESEASLHLHREAGFRMVGTLIEVGRKFDRLLDVHMLQKLL